MSRFYENGTCKSKHKSVGQESWEVTLSPNGSASNPYVLEIFRETNNEGLHKVTVLVTREEDHQVIYQLNVLEN